MNHFHSQIATGSPRAIAVLTQKLVADTILLSPELLQDAVSFSAAASASLMSVLGADSADSLISTEGDWVVPETG